MFIKTKRVRRANRTYEYLTLVESVRINGTNTHRTLFRLGEATALRESGELDRIIAALQAHAERRYVDLDDMEVDQAPMIGTLAAVRHLWDELDLGRLFDTIAAEAGLSWKLADAVFAMLAGRLVDPASKRRTHRWIVDDVVAPAGFSFPTLEQYYRALDVVHANKDLIERHVYAGVCDLTNLNLTLACYDLTSTYLEGDPAGHSRFPSKAFGYSRDRRSDRPQVVHRPPAGQPGPPARERHPRIRTGRTARRPRNRHPATAGQEPLHRHRHDERDQHQHAPDRGASSLAHHPTPRMALHAP
jgi:hypothetical protein